MDSDTSILRFSKMYQQIHGWLSTLCCLFGISCNSLNIIVLTRPKMNKSVTNLILNGLAIADLITMIFYLPQSIYFYIIKVTASIANKSFLTLSKWLILINIFKIKYQEPHPDRDTLFWTNYQKYNVIVTVTVHSISIWLTVYLACYRYVFIKTSSPKNVAATNRSKTHILLGRYVLKTQTYMATVSAMGLISNLKTLFWSKIKN